MQFGLDASRKAYEQTQADRQYALDKRGQYDQAVGAVMSESAKFDEATRRQELMQDAKADISREFSAAQEQQSARPVERAENMPGSGRACSAGQQAELAEAAAKSRAGLMVSEAAKKEGLQLRGSNVAMLAGYPAQAASLTPTGANLGVMGLDIANTAGAGMNEMFTGAGKAAADYGKTAADMWSGQNKLYTDSECCQRQGAQAQADRQRLVGLAGTAGYAGANNYNWNGSVMNTGRKGTSQNNPCGEAKPWAASQPHHHRTRAFRRRRRWR